MDPITGTSDSVVLLENVETEDYFEIVDTISQKSDCSATESCSSVAQLYGEEFMDYSNEENSVIEIDDDDEEKKGVDDKVGSITPTIMIINNHCSQKNSVSDVSVQTSSYLCSNSPNMVALQQQIKAARQEKRNLTGKISRTISKQMKIMVDNIKLPEYIKLTKKYFPNRGVSNFIITLLDASNKSPRGRRFSPAFKQVCLNLYLTAPPFYERKLSECFPLPRHQMLRDHAQAMLQRGDSNRLELLKMKADGMTAVQRTCVLRMCEVKLQPKFYYGLKSDRVTGVVQDEASGQLKHVRLVTVFVIHGFTSDWHQLVSHHFSASTPSSEKLYNLMEENISRLHSTNLKVVGVICDVNTSTEQMAESLHVSERCSSFMLHGRQIRFMFDIQQLTIKLWNIFTKTDLLLNGSLVSWRTAKDFAIEYFHLLPKHDYKLSTIFGRRYYKRIIRDKMVRAFTQYARQTDSGAAVKETQGTMRFLDIIKNFEDIVNEPERGTLRDVKKCYDHLANLKTVNEDYDIDFVACHRKILVTLRSIMTLWAGMRLKDIAYKGFLSVQSVIEFLSHYRYTKKTKFCRASPALMNPVQFNKIFKKFFVSELLNVSFIKNDPDLREINSSILCKPPEKKCPSESLSVGEFGEVKLIGTDYRSDIGLKRNFPKNICHYLLRKCLSVHKCSSCEMYVAAQTIHIESEFEELGRVFSRQEIEQHLDLDAVHPNFVGFVKSMELIFQQKLQNFAVLQDSAVFQLTRSFALLKLKHPCKHFPFTYVTLLFARVRLYYELMKLNKGKGKN